VRPHSQLVEYVVVARIFLERRDIAEDVWGWFTEYHRDWQSASPAAAECSPPMDVLETAAAVEILMDLPGVTLTSVKILFAQGLLVIGGTKLPVRCQHHEASFHLAERSFGRFARGVRVSGAFDTGRATATLTAGELRVVLPRIEERRGKHVHIPVEGE
jgi:HSP20 family protein